MISRNVKVTAAAVTHGPITATVSATNEVSQANPFADQGETVAIQNADVAIEEPANKMFLFQPGVDLREIVDAVNETGATPSSLIAILEALKSSGSLRAELCGDLMSVVSDPQTSYDFSALGALKASSCQRSVK